MRTTLDIDDEVLKVAKEIARQRRSTAGAVLSDLARKALTGQPGTPTGAVAEPAAFYGFRPFPADDRVVSEETIDKLRDQEGV